MIACLPAYYSSGRDESWRSCLFLRCLPVRIETLHTILLVVTNVGVAASSYVAYLYALRPGSAVDRVYTHTVMSAHCNITSIAIESTVNVRYFCCHTMNAARSNSSKRRHKPLVRHCTYSESNTENVTASCTERCRLIVATI
jgi:hypothetical protein